MTDGFICSICDKVRDRSEKVLSRRVGEHRLCVYCKALQNFESGCVNKVGYATLTKAIRGLSGASRHFGIDMHVYRCKFCHQFHLTKRAKRLWRGKAA